MTRIMIPGLAELLPEPECSLPYDSKFLTHVEADALLSVLLGLPVVHYQNDPDASPLDLDPMNVQWERTRIRRKADVPWIRVKRLSMVFCDLPYVGHGKVGALYDNNQLAHNWSKAPAELQAVREKLRRKYGFDFNLCSLQWYPDNKVGIGIHNDENAESDWNYPIATVSLGEERTFAFGKNEDVDWSTRRFRQAERIMPAHGSLLEMPAGFQSGHKHAIETDNSQHSEPRISLTFRVRRLTHVVNRHHGVPFDVYIGRKKSGPGEWGNPFSDNPASKAEYIVDSKDVMPMFRAWFENRIKNEPGFAERVRALKGKTLGCWCKPKPCHGDIIAEWADKL